MTIQGVGIGSVSVDSYRTASAYQRKEKKDGVSGDSAKKAVKSDEAVFSSKQENVQNKDEVLKDVGLGEKTNEEVVKGVQDEYKKLQANIVRTMLGSVGISASGNIKVNGKDVDLDKIFDLEIPESEKGLTADQLVEKLPDEWKPDAVAERIVDFATAFYAKSGLEGEEFYNKVKEAIGKGFGDADKQIGGKLPGNIKEVIEYTRNAVFAKLDKWAESAGIQIPYTGEDGSKANPVDVKG